MVARDRIVDCSNHSCSCSNVLILNMLVSTCVHVAIQIVDGVDIMVVRELTGDVYFGEPKVRTLYCALHVYAFIVCMQEGRLQ
jgi:isocitrate/isopropylmalate dehydrogenase